MRLYYDLHIHTCLSPCGDDDMTPNNIVNMALIKGLDVIAITDHNHAGNVESCMAAAKDTELLVIGGMEVETSEEIHMVVLFEDINSLRKLEAIIYDSLPKIDNKPDIFGQQYYMNNDDEIIGYENRFLITASSVDVHTLYKLVNELDGVIFPAHIDKSSYSIISNLGSIPEELEFGAVEVKKEMAGMSLSEKYEVLYNSDAHYLWDISEKENFIDVEHKCISEFLLKLKQKNDIICAKG